MKKVQKIFFYFLLALLFIFSTIVGYFYTKQDWIKNKTVEQLNLYLNAKVSVGEIGFSLFSHFPYASVVFNNVTINASNNCKDLNAPYFLKSKLIIIDFNWYSIFENEIKIRKINFENGSVNIWEKNGEENYQVFKKSDGAGKLSLDKIVIHNFLVNISIPENKISLALHNAKIKGDFYKDIYDLNIEANGSFFDSEILGFVKTGSKKFACKGKLISESNKKFTTKNLDFNLGNLKLKANGFIELLLEKQLAIELDISTNKASLSNLSAMVPILKTVNNNLVQKGEVKVKVKLSGNTLTKKGIEIKGNLNFENGYVEQQKVFIKDLKCKGDFILFSKSKEWSFFNLNFSGNTNVGSFKGNGKINGVENNFKSKLNLVGNHPLESASLLFEFPYINNPKGELRYNVIANIWETNKIRTITIEGNVAAKNVKGELKNGLPFSLDELFVDFNSSSFAISTKNLVCSDNDVSANLNIKSNADFSELEANGKLTSKQINVTTLEKIILFFNEGTSKVSRSFLGKFKMEVATIKREKLLATNFSSNLILDGSTIKANEIKMETTGGKAEGEILIYTKIPVKVSGNFKAENIDISKLFYSLNNFDQNIITNKNIYGTVNGNGKFSFALNKNNKVDEATILAESDVLIKDGKLKDFLPLFSLSKFIELDELKEIKFSELKNTIQISNRKVVIPKMDISTSVLNFKMAGIHTFDNEIDYHFELFLKELLAKKWKAKQRKNIDEEFGFVVEDENRGSKLFITMKGNANNPKISYDKLAGREEIKNIVKEESKTIKNLFKKEFKRNYRDSSESKKSKINHFEKSYFSIDEDVKVEKKAKIKETERIVPIEPEKQHQQKKKERKLDRLFKEKENKKEVTTDDF